jgi:hypothetical protein
MRLRPPNFGTLPALERLGSEKAKAMFSRKFSKKFTHGIVIALFIGVAMGSLALASDDPVSPRPWPERFLRSIKTATNRGLSSLSTALFNSIDKLDAELFKFPAETRVGVQIRRDVMDNFDLLNTYTVIDKARIQVKSAPLAKLSTWTEDAQTTGLGTPYAGVVFEPQTSIEWINARQVDSLRYRKDPPPNSALLEAQAILRGDPLPTPTPDPDLSDLNPGISQTFKDPTIRARFSKILNLVTFPFRLPLNRSDVSKMSDGEIIAYSFDGQVDVGLAVGLKVIPTLNVIHAGIDIRGTAVLRGRYQISVLRENERYARVKLTRLTEKGRKSHILVGIERKNAVNGFMLFKGAPTDKKSLLHFDLSVVPFDFEASRIRGDQFDVMYRYDLDSEAGKTAFHKAVLGSFATSEETIEAADQYPQAPVEKLVTRDSTRLTRDTRIKAGVLGLLNLDWNKKRESLQATLELPDGTHHVMEGMREKKRYNKSLFGSKNERTSKRVTLFLDAELLAKKDPEGAFFISEVTEEDSSTSAKELNSAIGRMEKLLHDPEVLPTMAMHTAGRKRLFDGRHAWYGRSSFYYGYTLSLDEITAFLQSSPTTVAVAARRNLPLQEAERFIGAWNFASIALASNVDAPELFRNLEALFTNHFPVESLTNIIFEVLPFTAYDTFVTAQNVGFGRVQIRGKKVPSTERALALTDRELGLETYSRRLKQDFESVVRNIQVTEQSDGLKVLNFNLSHTPTNVFFRLYRFTGMKRQKVLAEFVVNNQSGRFREGENSIVLDPYSENLLVAKLSRELREDEAYSLSVAYSRTFDRYGPVATSKFQGSGAYPSLKKK